MSPVVVYSDVGCEGDCCNFPRFAPGLMQILYLFAVWGRASRLSVISPDWIVILCVRNAGFLAGDQRDQRISNDTTSGIACLST